MNSVIQYEHYFAMIPTGPNPNAALMEGFFEPAATQSPRPLTAALLTADAEFSRNPAPGAKENAAKYGIKIVYEQRYPLSTTDFMPFIDQKKRTNADLLILYSYVEDSKFDQSDT